METMEKVVYLDNAATTACAPEVLAVMTQALSGACGNPSSHYSVGYEAKEFVDTGRAQVAKAINASPAEIFFTGCGSEADNWAVKGTAFTKARQNKKHLITSAFEHHAIMHSMAALERMGFEVTYIKPTAGGLHPPRGCGSGHPSRYRAGQHYDGQQRDRHHPAHQGDRGDRPQARRVDAHRRGAGCGCHPGGCRRSWAWICCP